MKLYLAGPMRGIPEFNFPAFHAGAEALRMDGHEVFNPAEKGAEADVIADPTLQEDLAFRRKVFAIDLGWICEHAEGVVLLPGWEYSKGARAERAAAEAVGLPVYLYNNGNILRVADAR